MRYLLLLLLTTVCANAQIGYISFQQVAPSLPEFESLQKKYTNRSTQLTDSMTLLINQYQQFLESTPGYLNDSLRSVGNDTLQQFQERLQKYQVYASEVLKREEQDLSDQLMKAMQRQLKLFCEKKKLTCIIEKDGVLYCPGCKDYTSDLISFLKGK